MFHVNVVTGKSSLTDKRSDEPPATASGCGRAPLQSHGHVLHGERRTHLTQVHIGAAISLVQAFLPGMKAKGYGRIVNMCTRAVLGLATRTSYSATKAGMMAMTRTWALELGQYGITVNAVAPGPIAATEMFDNTIPENDPRRESMAASIPVKRLGRPADVASATLFLASPGSGFITGQTLFVCGGASLGSLAL